LIRSGAIDHWLVLGGYVRALRASHGWSLRSVARAISITHSYLSDIEHGVVPPPSVAVITRMAETLDVPPADLLARAGRLDAASWRALWQHPALPPILSTLPGWSLTQATLLCEQILHHDPPPP
jgi:transcriptional regulator with XRE-family HTH domain